MKKLLTWAKANTRILTLIFIGVTLTSIIVYDSVMAANKISGDTISEIVFVWSKDYEAIRLSCATMIGALVGHWFWGQRA